MVKQQERYIDDDYENIRSILLPPGQFMGDLTREEQDIVAELKNKYDAMTDQIIMEVGCEMYSPTNDCHWCSGGCSFVVYSLRCDNNNHLGI